MVQTSKGKPKMIYEGFSFFQNCTIKNRIYWLCASNRRTKCNARIITSLDLDVIKTKRLVHNHFDNEPSFIKSDTSLIA